MDPQKQILILNAVWDSSKCAKLTQKSNMRPVGVFRGATWTVLFRSEEVSFTQLINNNKTDQWSRSVLSCRLGSHTIKRPIQMDTNPILWWPSKMYLKQKSITIPCTNKQPFYPCISVGGQCYALPRAVRRRAALPPPALSQSTRITVGRRKSAISQTHDLTRVNYGASITTEVAANFGSQRLPLRKM